MIPCVLVSSRADNFEARCTTSLVCAAPGHIWGAWRASRRLKPWKHEPSDAAWARFHRAERACWKLAVEKRSHRWILLDLVQSFFYLRPAAKGAVDLAELLHRMGISRRRLYEVCRLYPHVVQIKVHEGCFYATFGKGFRL